MPPDSRGQYGGYPLRACDLKYDMAWGGGVDNSGNDRYYNNNIFAMRGGVTPDPKNHPSGGRPGRNMNEWIHAEAGKANYRDFKAPDLNSPMCLPGIIKESPRGLPFL